jgi:hypothetical protein
MYFLENSVLNSNVLRDGVYAEIVRFVLCDLIN